MGRSKNAFERLPTMSKENLQKFEIFRHNLGLLRIRQGLSAKELGKHLNFKKFYWIHDLEYGRRIPKLDDVMAIAKFFDVTIDQLLYEKAEIAFSLRGK